ncbi:hypothetical protein F511_05014 [Dorcoceras hygrometricum]|uniref:Ig-like domain-containing protein n=1 Tax=Dorcoceras hygrometricum TaxID=472368 RepID=A0A2Z7AN15_9LAMI|nr:hypothetical protein F511_05014 [Dorcoceras hygrometricum]
MSSSISQDDKLSQLIRDYFESGGSTVTESCFYLSSRSSRLDHDDPTHYSNLQEILEDRTEAENEIHGKVLMYLRDADEFVLKNIRKLRKLIVYRLEKDNYESHLCRTSWSTPFDCPSGEYEYVEVVMRNKDGGTVRVIVDLDFRTEFELARPTPDYEELKDALPSIFVGDEEKIDKLVSLVCSAAKQSLKARGLHIPPWRKESHMKSKWLSSNRKRVSSAEFMSCLSKYMTQNGNACFLDLVQADQQLGTYNC